MPWVLLLVLFAAACGGGEEPQAGGREQGGNILGPGGGTVSAPSGAATLTVPPGAVPAGTEIDIGPGYLEPGAPAPLAGTAFTVGPAGLVLSRPATLTIRYDANGLTAGVESSAGLYAEDGVSWPAVQGSGADLARRSVSGPVTGPGTYAVFAPGPVASLTVNPNSVTVVFGTTQQMLCELRDSTGRLLENRPILWSSSDTSVVQVSQAGKVTPVSLGYARITASSGGASGVSNITSAFSCNCPTFTTGVARAAGTCLCVGQAPFTAGERPLAPDSLPGKVAAP